MVKRIDNVLNNAANEIFNSLLKELDFDSDYYNKFDKCPIFLIKNLFCKGMYLSPKQIQNNNLKELFTSEEEKLTRKYGAILINIPKKKNLSQTDKADILLSIIHEKIHFKRNIMNGFDNNYSIDDAYQDILTLNYDFDKIDLIKHTKTSSEKKANQVIIDEALVELMSVFSYFLWKNEKFNIKEDPFKVLKRINTYFDEYEDYDIITMCEIILKHHDFELFKWMLNPLEYQIGDISFDYFDYYTKNDQDLVNKLFGIKAKRMIKK